MWQLTLSPCSAPEQDTLIALLDGLGSDGFWQDGPHLHSYWLQTPPTEVWAQVRAAVPQLPEPTLTELPDTNWNATWEAAYDPVDIPGICQIHATFHTPDPAFPLHIAIQPQMSFGTGHHATTRLMIRLLAQAVPTPGQVLDMGCGTGVLGIYAMLTGATAATFVDIDPACVTNTQENLALNGLEAPVWQGGGPQLPATLQVDTLLANINRNVLLADGAAYVQALRPGGHLLLSGFLAADTETVLAHYSSLGLHLTARLEEDQWQCLCLKK